MWKKLVIALLLAGIALSGYLWWQRDPALWVQTARVERGSVESTLQLTGKVINDRTVTITALLDGEIIDIRAREGEIVEAGDVLAELDSRQAQALVDKASAELVIQRQALDTAIRNHERLQRLSGAGTATEQALDDSLDQRFSAAAALKAAQATLTLNQLRLDNASIRSPFAGTVIEQSAETGQWVEAGTPLFTVVATEGRVIEAFANASDWSGISLSQAARLSTEAPSELSWDSLVSWIAPTVSTDDNSGNSVAVRFPIGDTAPALLLGQEIDVDLLMARVEDVPIVALDSLIEDDNGDYSAFVLDGNTARRQSVILGITSLSSAEIVSGLNEGDELLVSPLQAVRDGQTVKISAP